MAEEKLSGPAAAAVDEAAARMEANLESEDATQELLDDIHADAAAQAGVSLDTAFGRVGPPFDRRAPFLVGFSGALGVACAVAAAWAVVVAGQVLVLLGLAFFIAVGLDPAVVCSTGGGCRAGQPCSWCS